MCNKIHSSGPLKAIPRRGIGYKLFHRNIVSGEYETIHGGQFTKDVNKWARWQEDRHGQEDGFCFFLNKEEAERAAFDWNSCSPALKVVVKEIVYDHGLCEEPENKFIGGDVFNVALCKQFKIKEELTYLGE